MSIKHAAQCLGHGVVTQRGVSAHLNPRPRGRAATFSGRALGSGTPHSEARRPCLLLTL